MENAYFTGTAWYHCRVLTGRYAASPFLCLAWAPAAWRLAVMSLDPPEPRVGAGGLGSALDVCYKGAI